MPIKSYKELIVWQKSILLADEVYKIVRRLPKEEYYILASQMLRAVISISSNIAEGYMRNHRTEFIHFLSISLGSAGELESQLILCRKQYPNIEYDKAEALSNEILKMLFVLMNKLKAKTRLPT